MPHGYKYNNCDVINKVTCDVINKVTCDVSQVFNSGSVLLFISKLSIIVIFCSNFRFKGCLKTMAMLAIVTRKSYHTIYQ